MLIVKVGIFIVKALSYRLFEIFRIGHHLMILMTEIHCLFMIILLYKNILYTTMSFNICYEKKEQNYK